MGEDTQASLAMLNQTINNASAYIGNVAESRRQRDWQSKEAEKAFERSLQVWRMSNEYNTPSAQVDRLRDAGLNPLFYGLDGSSSNAFEAPQASPYQRAQFDSLPNPILEGLQASALQAQIENTQSDTAKKNEETLTQVKTREKMVAEMEKIKEDINNLIVNRDYTSEQLENLRIINRYADAFQQAALHNTEADTKLKQSTRDRIDKLVEGEVKIQIKTVEQLDATIKKIIKECKVLASQEQLNELDITNYALNHLSQGWLGSGLSVQNILRGLILYYESLDGNEGDGTGAMDPPNSSGLKMPDIN